MSEIITNKLTGKTAAKTVTVTVGATVTQDLEKGLAKAFMNYDASSNTIEDSTNISTVRDNGTGDFDVVVTNNYSNSTPSICLATGHQSFIGHTQKSETNSSETRIETDNNNGSARDRNQTIYVGHGGLA